MPIFSICWNIMPPAAKRGIILWVAAWIFFLSNMNRLLGDSGTVMKLALAVILLSFFLLRGQNWARMIALMADAMSVLFLGFLVYLFNLRGDFVETGASFIGLLLFVLSIYFLTHREAVHFFKTHSKVQSETDDKSG